MTFICAIAEGGRDGRPRVGSGPALGLDGEKQARSRRRVGAKEARRIIAVGGDDTLFRGVEFRCALVILWAAAAAESAI